MKKNNVPGSANAGSSSGVANGIKNYRWVIVWCIFHLCALILSYKEVKFFNNTGEPRTDRFWPFVNFTYPGFLPQYDWTEFSFYTGIVLLFFLIRFVYRKSE